MSLVDWEDIYSLLLAEGFVDAGWTPAGKVDEAVVRVYLSWISTGFHADMKYLEKNIELRLNPQVLHPGIKTIITVLYPWPVHEKIDTPLKISAYALGKDYHDEMRVKIKSTMDFIEGHGKIKPRFVTDSAPMLDRFWAWKAGLGFIGKNTMLIHPRFGSRLFIGHILTDVEIKGERKEPLLQQCGQCERCLQACPTGALVKPYVLDSRRCLSYWTIEAKIDPPSEILKLNPGWIFGCDICTDVCPYNKVSPLKTREKRFYDLINQQDWEKLFSARKQLPLIRVSKTKLMTWISFFQTK